MKPDNKSSIEVSVNDIDDHHQQRDALQQELGGETCLNEKTVTEYEDEDRYAIQGYEDDDEKRTWRLHH